MIKVRGIMITANTILEIEMVVGLLLLIAGLIFATVDVAISGLAMLLCGSMPYAVIVFFRSI